jgi:hypothetical protein
MHDGACGERDNATHERLTMLNKRPWNHTLFRRNPSDLVCFHCSFRKREPGFKSRVPRSDVSRNSRK